MIAILQEELSTEYMIIQWQSDYLRYVDRHFLKETIFQKGDAALMKQEKPLEEGTESATTKTFLIRGRFYKNHCFPSLNDYLQEIGRNPKGASKFKRDFVFIAINAIRRDLKGYKFTKPVILHYTFGEPLQVTQTCKRRDRDNIVALAQKFILDALRDSHTIVDDKPDYVRNFDFSFVYTDRVPYIMVDIEEV